MATTAFRTVIAARQDLLPVAARQSLVGGLVVLGVLYNGIYAMLAAHGAPLSLALVAVAEIGILGAALLVVLRARLDAGDILPLAFLWISLLIASGMSLYAQWPYLDGVRNIMIVTIFTMLGARATARTMRIVLVVLLLVVLAVLMIEVFALDTYVSLFQPSAYIRSTRGIGLAEFNDTGLFNNALGYRGRFTFGIFTGPRTSSVFLEQVGLANFAALAMLCVVTLWEGLPRWQRALGIGAVMFMLVSNNARAASAIAVIFMLLIFVQRYVPRWSGLLVPLAIVLALLVPALPIDAEAGDSVLGRIVLAQEKIASLDVIDLLGGRGFDADRFGDSGYAFLIASTTLLGAVLFVGYVLFVVKPGTPPQRRLAIGLPIYVFANLLVSGTSIFSLKTAALLWFLVGFVRSRADTPPTAPAIEGKRS